MRRLLAVVVGSLIVALLAGCSAATPGVTTTRPTVEPGTVITTAPPGPFTASTPEWQACISLYTETDDPDFAFAQCVALTRENDRNVLRRSFTDPEWIEQEKARRLFEKGGTGPYRLVEVYAIADGTLTEPTLTITDGTGSVVQKHVSLPYSEQMPAAGILSVNIIWLGGAVGCRITTFSEAQPLGLVVADQPAVDGQVMAQCTDS